MLDRVAPQGLALDNVSRVKSLESLEAVFSRYPSAELVHARKVLERITGDPTVGPHFIKGNGFALRTTTHGDSPATQHILFSPEGADNHHPAIEIFYHELAHWAYFNILTPKDRAHFWDLTTKYYQANGQLDKNKIRDGVPTYNMMEMGEGRRINGVNTMDSPQEFFANQLVTWAMRKDIPKEMRDEAYWQRIVKYVKAIYDRYYRGVKIDADLEPLFAKSCHLKKQPSLN